MAEHTAQDLIQMLHDVGMSDGEIARAISVAEATIARVRTGKSTGIVVRPWLQQYIDEHRADLIADLKRKIAQLEGTQLPAQD